MKEFPEMKVVVWIVSLKEESLKPTVEDHVASLTSYSDQQSVGFDSKVILKEEVDWMVVCS